MSWLTDCAEHIEDTVAGQTVGTTVFYDFMPDSPDAAVCVYDAGGNMQPQGVGVPWSEHRLEVRVRSTTNSLARTLMDSITTALHGKYGSTWNTTTKVQFCRLDQEPHYLYSDQRGRAYFLARYTLHVQRGTYVA